MKYDNYHATVFFPDWVSKQDLDTSRFPKARQHSVSFLTDDHYMIDAKFPENVLIGSAEGTIDALLKDLIPAFPTIEALRSHYQDGVIKESISYLKEQEEDKTIYKIRQDDAHLISKLIAIGSATLQDRIVNHEIKLEKDNELMDLYAYLGCTTDSGRGTVVYVEGPSLQQALQRTLTIIGYKADIERKYGLLQDEICEINNVRKIKTP